MNKAEEHIINFYEFDYKYRGVALYDYVVNIQQPYKTFKRYNSSAPTYIDDSKSLSVFESIKKFISPKTETPISTFKDELLPLQYKAQENLVGISIQLQANNEINPLVSKEFLNCLTYSKHPIAYEIIGTYSNITIQFVCHEIDAPRLQAHLKAYFPSITIKLIDAFNIGFDFNKKVAIADFGLEQEVVLGINSVTSFSIDPLTSIIATIENLEINEIALFQIIFQGINTPVSNDLMKSVTDDYGNSFFIELEMLSGAQAKISEPLFSCVMRIATQGNNQNRSSYLGIELAQSISRISASVYNRLIPLSNERYDYEQHLFNIYHRTSNRSSFLLNTTEISVFAHLPNKTIASQKLFPKLTKTKALPKACIGQKYILGINEHNGKSQEASVSPEILGRHLMITGNSGSGKSHFLKLLIKQIAFKESVIVIDPHTQLVEDILSTIEDKNKDDVVYIDITNHDFAFGFNIFSAKTEEERSVLASDVSKSFSESWISSGDRIQSVLMKTISVLVYSDKEASLLDMKRFLLEAKFRELFLESVDPILRYYFKHEFPLIKRHELSPLILRIDNFLQTRLLQNIFIQRQGIDFEELIAQKKLVLINVGVGQIGFSNAQFIARIIINKVNQIALGRKNIQEQHPIRLICEEANLYTKNNSSIEHILSGSRKVKLSLVAIFQHLDQLDSETLESFLANAACQIYFNLNHKNATKITNSFSYFDAEDFMNLEQGEALVRINKRSNDFNLKTLALANHIDEAEAQKTKAYIIKNSLETYATPISEINEMVKEILPKEYVAKTKAVKPRTEIIDKVKVPVPIETITTEQTKISEQQRNELIVTEETKTQERDHIYLQTLVKKLGQERGYLATIEKELPNGQRIDITLEKDTQKIAFEVAIHNKADFELGNIKKALLFGYNPIVVLSKNRKHLNTIEQLTIDEISKTDMRSIHFIQPNSITKILDNLKTKTTVQHEVVKGFRITTEYERTPLQNSKSVREHITKMLFKKR